MSAGPCNCSILGGTTDSRPCPVHDTPPDPHESGHIMVTPAYAESAARYGIHYPADWILPDDPVVAS